MDILIDLKIYTFDSKLFFYCFYSLYLTYTKIPQIMIVLGEQKRKTGKIRFLLVLGRIHQWSRNFKISFLTPGPLLEKPIFA